MSRPSRGLGGPPVSKGDAKGSFNRQLRLKPKSVQVYRQRLRGGRREGGCDITGKTGEEVRMPATGSSSVRTEINTDVPPMAKNGGKPQSPEGRRRLVKNGQGPTAARYLVYAHLYLQGRRVRMAGDRAQALQGSDGSPIACLPKGPAEKSARNGSEDVGKSQLVIPTQSARLEGRAQWCHSEPSCHRHGQRAFHLQRSKTGFCPHAFYEEPGALRHLISLTVRCPLLGWFESSRSKDFIEIRLDRLHFGIYGCGGRRSRDPLCRGTRRTVSDAPSRQ